MIESCYIITSHFKISHELYINYFVLRLLRQWSITSNRYYGYSTTIYMLGKLLKFITQLLKILYIVDCVTFTLKSRWCYPTPSLVLLVCSPAAFCNWEWAVLVIAIVLLSTLCCLASLWSWFWEILRVVFNAIFIVCIVAFCFGKTLCRSHDRTVKARPN